MAALALPRGAWADAACATGQFSVPNMLTLDCASRRNFKLFRQYSAYVGLAGIVCVKTAQGAHGTYNVGSLLLYPWLKPAGQASKQIAAKLACALPTGSSTAKVTAAKPIPNALLPQDEYICRYIIQAPWQDFIGFSVDVPSQSAANGPWRTSVPNLGDGLGVDIQWVSANLNTAWFGGHVIPADGTCNGAAWRRLILDTLNQASKSAC